MSIFLDKKSWLIISEVKFWESLGSGSYLRDTHAPRPTDVSFLPTVAAVARGKENWNCIWFTKERDRKGKKNCAACSLPFITTWPEHGLQFCFRTSFFWVFVFSVFVFSKRLKKEPRNRGWTAIIPLGFDQDPFVYAMHIHIYIYIYIYIYITYYRRPC